MPHKPILRPVASWSDQGPKKQSFSFFFRSLPRVSKVQTVGRSRPLDKHAVKGHVGGERDGHGAVRDYDCMNS